MAGVLVLELAGVLVLAGVLELVLAEAGDEAEILAAVLVSVLAGKL